MSPNDFMKLQVRLMIAHFGRRNVLEALATASDMSPEELEKELAELKQRSSAKRTKREKSLEEMITGLPPMDDERRKMVEHLGRQFESKQFLPELRDAQEFFRKGGAVAKKHRSRRDALIAVLKMLRTMPLDELSALVSETTGGAGQSDFTLLANQLMGKGR
jgi:hypothetical protein